MLPIAAGADFSQNVSLALVLAGHVPQPGPGSAVAGSTITPLVLAAALFTLVGAFATRGRADV